ncbi:MAG: vitamin K epoxide reductase family protein [Candidatus Kaiserbacteria bacterium]|nr:vitamin K epoxide reductase family protein [Candidatus Kaiserbacteria bacterium]
MKRAGVIAILALSFLGLADSAYIAQHETSGAPLICDINNLSGCNIVVASPYSYLFGVPIAEYGIIFYSILFVLAALELVVFDQLLRRALQGISLIGVIASLYFTLIQVFVINALCIYCLASAFIALVILICASFIEPLSRSAQSSPPLIV